MANTPTAMVAPGNVEQARAWDGSEGQLWAAHAEWFEQGTGRYDGELLATARITPSSQVLDVGCGTGSTTRAAARAATSGAALGVDLSSQMTAVARRRAEQDGLSNARFEQGDAQVYPFVPGSFDVVLSKTSAMFFSDPVAAFRNLAGALRPGGRLVLLVWQDFTKNEWTQDIFTALAAGRSLPAPPPGAPGPFSMADPARVRALLEQAGFAAIEARDVRQPMYFGTDADYAHRVLGDLMAWMLDGLGAEARVQALEELRRTIATHKTPQGILFGSAAWLVSAERPPG